MLPALRKVVFAKDRPMPTRSSRESAAATKAQGSAHRSASAGASSTSCQAGSKCRSYQATYSSTMALVAGCVVTSSTSPSPITQTLRPSRKASRYSAPVRMPTPLPAPPTPAPGFDQASGTAPGDYRATACGAMGRSIALPLEGMARQARHLDAQRIDRGMGGEEQGLHVGAAKAQIGRHFRAS